MDILLGIFLPFLGTAAGAACVFFLKNELKPQVQKALLAAEKSEVQVEVLRRV